MVAVYHVYKLQFHTLSLLYDSTWNNLQKQQYRQVEICSLLCILQTMLILYLYACTVEYLYAVCKLLNNGQ